MPTQKLKLDEIRIDGGTQPRAEIDQAVVAEYAEDMAAGAAFPPVEVYCDGAVFWLIDGFHRYHALRLRGARTIEALIRHGTQKDARWAALAANRQHGLRRSVDDKQRAVAGALKQRPDLSNVAIAEHVGVSEGMVRTMRAGLEAGSQVTRVTERTGRDGKTYPAAQPSAAEEPSGNGPAGTSTVPARRDSPATDGTGSPPAASKDALGRPIPEDRKCTEKIRDAFARAGAIDRLMRLVSEVKCEVMKAAATGDQLYAALTVTAFQAECENVRRHLRFVRPHAVCPYCGGDGCRACLGRGWVGEQLWDSAPPEMKK